MLFIAIHGYLSLILIFLGGNDAEAQKASGAEEAGDADFAAEIVAKIAAVDEAAEAETKADKVAAEDEAKVNAAAVTGADVALSILVAEAQAKS